MAFVYILPFRVAKRTRFGARVVTEMVRGTRCDNLGTTLGPDRIGRIHLVPEFVAPFEPWLQVRLGAESRPANRKTLLAILPNSELRPSLKIGGCPRISRRPIRRMIRESAASPMVQSSLCMPIVCLLAKNICTAHRSSFSSRMENLRSEATLSKSDRKTKHFI